MPSPSVDREFIAAALIGARQLVVKMYGTDSSVFSTRLAMDVWEHFGYDAEPMSVHIIIANPVLVKALNEETADILDKKTWPDFSHALSMGWIENKGGHLVAVSGDILLDLALDHANNEHAKVELSSRAFRIEPAFLAGQPMQFELNGCSLAYTRVMYAERWWTKHQQWGRKDGYIRERLAGDIIRAIKAKLQAS